MKKNTVIISLLMSIFLYACCTNNVQDNKNLDSIDEKIYININGISQYLLIRGNNINNPVILYIHGGPGIPYTSMLYDMIEVLKDDFTVVAYDQRGVGRTYYETKKTNPENNIITKELLLKDLDSTVDYLLSRFHKDKIIIVGHSYGSLIGVTYLNTHPQKVQHYIGLAQSVNRQKVVEVTYKKARSLLEDNSKEQKQLDEDYNYVITHDDTKRDMKLQKKIDKILTKTMDGLINKNVVKIALSSPDFEFADFKYFASFINLKELFKRNKESMTWLEEANLMEENKDFSVPMSFISGEYDETCPLELIYEYIEEINAPYKNFVIIPKVGHSPQIVVGKAVGEAIKSEIRNLDK